MHCPTACMILHFQAIIKPIGRVISNKRQLNALQFQAGVVKTPVIVVFYVSTVQFMYPRILKGACRYMIRKTTV